MSVIVVCAYILKEWYTQFSQRVDCISCRSCMAFSRFTLLKLWLCEVNVICIWGFREGTSMHKLLMSLRSVALELLIPDGSMRHLSFIHNQYQLVSHYLVWLKVHQFVFATVWGSGYVLLPIQMSSFMTNHTHSIPMTWH